MAAAVATGQVLREGRLRPLLGLASTSSRTGFPIVTLARRGVHQEIRRLTLPVGAMAEEAHGADLPQSLQDRLQRPATFDAMHRRRPSRRVPTGRAMSLLSISP